MVRRDTGEWKKVGDARAPGFGGLAFGGRVDDGNNGRETEGGANREAVGAAGGAGGGDIWGPVESDHTMPHQRGP